MLASVLAVDGLGDGPRGARGRSQRWVQVASRDALLVNRNIQHLRKYVTADARATGSCVSLEPDLRRAQAGDETGIMRDTVDERRVLSWIINWAGLGLNRLRVRVSCPICRPCSGAAEASFG